MDEVRRVVAVTGATGFLGQHLVDRLLEDGYQMRILTRDTEKAHHFRSQVEKVVVADIGDRAALEDLVDSVDAVIHLVSNFRTASGSPESYRQINVKGTLNILDVAEAAGVRRFIHCSTIGVHGHVHSTPADENAPFNPGDLYQQTKMEAELLCQERAKCSSMEIVMIRPCSLYGPGDMRMLKMFRMLARRTFVMLGPCREHFHAVYIDDAVEGFARALRTPDTDGEVFIIGGETYLPLSEYVAAAARAVGAPKPWLWLPYWPIFAASALCEAACVPLGIEPPLHRRRVRFYRNNRAFSIEKARRVLGYQPKIDLDEGLRRTVKWYKEHSYLP